LREVVYPVLEFKEEKRTFTKEALYVVIYTHTILKPGLRIVFIAAEERRPSPATSVRTDYRGPTVSTRE
jgi:hypothetical protein